LTGISDRRVRLLTVVVGVAGVIAAAVTPAAAQDISVNFGQGSGLTERVIQMIALLTVLSLAPSILVMMTSFTRIVVVLSLLRTALGTATAPPNAVTLSLSAGRGSCVSSRAVFVSRAQTASTTLPPAAPQPGAALRLARRLPATVILTGINARWDQNGQPSLNFGG
jgi:hypothetical protein